MKSFIVIQTAFVGDVVLTTPLIRTLERAFPDSKIDILLTPASADLLKGMKGVREVIAYDKRGGEKGLLGFISKVRMLRARKYDVCVAPHRSARTALLSFLSGIPVRIGFENAQLGFLYTHRVPRPKSAHEVDKNLGLLAALGITYEESDRALELPLDQSTEQESRSLLSEVGISDKDLLIGIGPGSVWGTKRWLPSGYAEVCDTLVKNFNARIVLLGGNGDSQAAGEVMASSGRGVENLVGKTTLKQALGVLSRCRLYIGNDSALLHFASALQVPCVGIFGPTVPAQGFSPLDSSSVVVEKKGLSCRPCGAHGPMKCPEGHFKCMAEIPPLEVIQAAERFLAEKTP